MSLDIPPSRRGPAAEDIHRQGAVRLPEKVPEAFKGWGSPVVGIDASVAKAGYAVIWNGWVKHWLFQPKGRGVARMLEHRKELQGVIRRYRPGCVVLEAYAFGAKGHAHATGEVGGILRVCCADNGVPTFEMSPNTLKKFVTGKGVGQKSAIALHLYKGFGLSVEQDDEADATVLALAASANMQNDHADRLKYQREALFAMNKLFP